MPLEALEHRWNSWMLPMVWQVSLLILLLLAFDLLARRRVWPQVRMALWLLVPLKLLLPPDLTSPYSVTPHVLATLPVMAADAAVASEPAPAISYLALRYAGPPNEPRATREEERGLPLWLSVWALGVLACLGHGLRRERRLRKRIAQGSVPAPPWLEHVYRSAARSLELRRRPPLVLTEALDGPAVVGTFAPWVSFPHRWLHERRADEIELALLHELGHVKRRDPLFGGLFFLLHSLYWFHPLLPLVRRRLEELREVGCDALVVRTLAGDTKKYQRALLASVAHLVGERPRPALPFTGGTSIVLHRLYWLQRGGWRWRGLRRLLGGFAGVLLSIVVLPMATADDVRSATTPRPAVLVLQVQGTTIGSRPTVAPSRELVDQAFDRRTKLNCVRLHMAARYLGATGGVPRSD